MHQVPLITLNLDSSLLRLRTGRLIQHVDFLMDCVIILMDEGTTGFRSLSPVASGSSLEG